MMSSEPGGWGYCQEAPNNKGREREAKWGRREDRTEKAEDVGSKVENTKGGSLMWFVVITENKVKGCVICKVHMKNKGSTIGNVLVNHNAVTHRIVNIIEVLNNELMVLSPQKQLEGYLCTPLFDPCAIVRVSTVQYVCCNEKKSG